MPKQTSGCAFVWPLVVVFTGSRHDAVFERCRERKSGSGRKGERESCMSEGREREREGDRIFDERRRERRVDLERMGHERNPVVV